MRKYENPYRLAEKTAWKLHTQNFDGDLHESSTAINKKGWAEYVVVMDYSGYNTVVVFKMPAEMVYKIRRYSDDYDPHHDDCKEK